MNVKDFISKYNNHPVLFIGTGVLDTLIIHILGMDFSRKS